jgi:hypothetical protein
MDSNNSSAMICRLCFALDSALTLVDQTENVYQCNKCDAKLVWHGGDEWDLHVEKAEPEQSNC